MRIDRERAELQARNRLMGERIAQLTPREKEVLQGIFEGKLTKVIADELGIGVRTAETYRQLIMQKLQAGSIAELVRIVVETMPMNPAVLRERSASGQLHECLEPCCQHKTPASSFRCKPESNFMARMLCPGLRRSIKSIPVS